MSNTQELNNKKQELTIRGVSVMCDWFVEKAENSTIWDTDGNQYTDFGGGIAVLNTGHRHPKVMEAVFAQLNKFTHTSYQITPYSIYLEVAEKISTLAPIQGPAKTTFFTTGAEAVENAVKIARAYTKRAGIITFANAFHGRSFMTMAMTGKTKPYKTDFGLMPAGVFHAKYPSEQHGISVLDAIQSIEDLFASSIAPHDVAAIVIEPVQGEGGFNVVPVEFLIQLRHLCDAHGILLVADEVQSGFGRTGQVFAMQHYAVQADLITMAKSLGGGFPISAVVGRTDVMDAPNPGGIGGTYAGNPVALAAANAVIEIIESEKLCERADSLGQQLVKSLKVSQQSSRGIIQDIRGLGSMIAVELKTVEQTKFIQKYAMDHGLLILTCGKLGNVIRFLYPLTIPQTQFAAALDILENAFTALDQIENKSEQSIGAIA